jgi:multidrug efflux pump subunit AcrA (membrane-fusion protein)
VVENGQVKLRPVEVGYISLTAVEILKGLKAGDLVIVDQLDKFRDGDHVRVEEVSAM